MSADYNNREDYSGSMSDSHGEYGRQNYTDIDRDDQVVTDTAVFNQGPQRNGPSEYSQL